MELKLDRPPWNIPQARGLNRTFYGIETPRLLIVTLFIIVLIVPFMELKHLSSATRFARSLCLNRTFYGIETSLTD